MAPTGLTMCRQQSLSNSSYGCWNPWGLLVQYWLRVLVQHGRCSENCDSINRDFEATVDSSSRQAHLLTSVYGNEDILTSKQLEVIFAFGTNAYGPGLAGLSIPSRFTILTLASIDVR